MANKIPWYKSVDWNLTFGLTAAIALIIGISVLIRLPEIIRSIKTNNYEGSTIGYLEKIDENTRLRQGLDGTEFVIESYSVKYFYKVSEVTYTGTDVIESTVDNYNKLQNIQNNPDRSIKVKYDKKDPSKSVVVLLK